MRVLLVGCGNSLRRDDGAAWHIVEDLAGRWEDKVQVRLGQQLLPEWAADVADADVALIVDASSAALPRLTRLCRSSNGRVDGHVFGVPELLALSNEVYGRSAVTYLLEVPASDFDFGQQLSSATAAAVTESIALVERCFSALFCGACDAASLESVAQPGPECAHDEPPHR